jgi:hypothetical protein
VWLRHHHQRTVSRATISRYLTRHGLVVSKPKKRPRSSYIRFEAALPNETWQADFTHYRLLADGSNAEILNWLDGHPPLRLARHLPAPGHRAYRARHLQPSRRRPWRARPHADRQRQDDEELAACPPRPAGHPHPSRRSWIAPSTSTTTTARTDPRHGAPLPPAIYSALPKALPTGSRDTDTHTRICHDRIDPSGVVTLHVDGGWGLHHIGVGRTRAGVTSFP